MQVKAKRQHPWITGFVQVYQIDQYSAHWRASMHGVAATKAHQGALQAAIRAATAQRMPVDGVRDRRKPHLSASHTGGCRRSRQGRLSCSGAVAPPPGVFLLLYTVTLATK